jgi:alpha-glutamyl/putrescinyl thymine pyrophosphorylase clade 1
VLSLGTVTRWLSRRHPTSKTLPLLCTRNRENFGLDPELFESASVLTRPGDSPPSANVSSMARRRHAARVSQTLIRDVIYAGSQDVEEVAFRTLLFEIFNKTET